MSVVIPTKDRPALLRETLVTVLWQRGVDIEVLVVDDGSTAELAAEVPELGHPSVRIIRHDRPQGVSAARNHGVRESNGEWIAFLDDDDLWAPDKLRAQLDAAARDARWWAVTGAVSVNGELMVLAGEPPAPPETIVAELPRYNAVPVGASNVVAHRSVLAQAGEFDPGLRHMADWDLWIRLGRGGLPATVDRPLVAYRLHAGSATMDTAIDADEPITELRVIARRYGIPADRAAVHRWIAWSCLRAGQRGAALRAYARAVQAGDVTSVARIAVALVHPGVGKRVFYRPFRRHGIDVAWTAETEAWLEQLRTMVAERES